MKRSGTTIIELLIAVGLVTVGFFATIRMILMAANHTKQLTHRNEAKIIAKTHLEQAESIAKSDFMAIATKSWQYENTNPVYNQLGILLSKNYYVKEDVEYVVMDQALSAEEDKPYRVRAMIDTDNNGADDYTGQGYDMKKITVTVSWAEVTRAANITEALNALLSNNQQYFRDNRMRDFVMATVISSYKPSDQACCDNPTIDTIEIYSDSGDNYDLSHGATLTVSVPYKVRIALNDQCVSRLPIVQLRYWYYGETEASARTLDMKYAGNLNYYTAELSGSEIKNADIASGYGTDLTCQEDTFDVEPYDMIFQIYARDNFIGESCKTTVRESLSETFPANVKDIEKPTITDYTSRIVASGCDGLILATIYDGANGVSGLNDSTVKAFLGRVDASGDVGELAELMSRTGPDASGRYVWYVSDSEIYDWSGEGTFDDKPDLYYYITASDKCGNTVDTTGDTSTYITITAYDYSPPAIYPNYNGLGFAECVPYGQPINISFEVIDECQVYYAYGYMYGYDYISGRQYWEYVLNYIPYGYQYHYIGTETDYTYTYSSVTFPSLNWHSFNYDYYPLIRQDLYFYMAACDNSDSYNWTMMPDDYWTGDKKIHQGNALTFYSEDPDPVGTGEVELLGTYGETVAMTLYNFRQEEIILSGIDIVEPVAKLICVSAGDTSLAYPYLDSVTLEVWDYWSGYYKKNVVWDWRYDQPTPDSRERGPIEIFFRNDDMEKLRVWGYATVKLYMYFKDRPTDYPYNANPFGMDQTDWDITLKSDQTQDYKCDNQLTFSTKTFEYNFPPVAVAGTPMVAVVDVQTYFEGRGCSDCDNTKDELTYYWDFGDGESAYGATAYHVYTSTDFYSLKTAGAPDTTSAIVPVSLTVWDPSGNTDSDTSYIFLFLYPTGPRAELCGNGYDDDLDGYTDCDDPECFSTPGCYEDCGNGIDDDGDGDIDCDDGDCYGHSPCGGTAEICDNGIDDDGDGDIDCADTDCSGAGNCIESVCNNGIDDDGDGLTDCQDGDCAGDAACLTNIAPTIVSITCANNDNTNKTKITFTVTVSDPDDTNFTYIFDFGDTVANTTNGGLTVSVTHPYSVLSPSYTMRVTVYDSAGNFIMGTKGITCTSTPAKCTCN